MGVVCKTGGKRKQAMFSSFGLEFDSVNVDLDHICMHMYSNVLSTGVAHHRVAV